MSDLTLKSCHPEQQYPRWRSISNPYLLGRRKQALDLVIVLLAAPVVVPLVMLLAALVVLTTGDPPFFRQQRHGLHRTPFFIWKLRTMRSVAGDEAFRQAVSDDQRTTRIGKFLRKTSLDELPQLWNVVKGDMSLVGPRPHPIELDLQFLPLIPGYARRFDARPGMSGLAQVRGARGETPTVVSMAKRVRYDAGYVKVASLKVDLMILWETIGTVLKGDQAY